MRKKKGTCHTNRWFNTILQICALSVDLCMCVLSYHVLSLQWRGSLGLPACHPDRLTGRQQHPESLGQSTAAASAPPHTLGRGQKQCLTGDENVQRCHNASATLIWQTPTYCRPFTTTKEMMLRIVRGSINCHQMHIQEPFSLRGLHLLAFHNGFNLYESCLVLKIKRKQLY